MTEFWQSLDVWWQKYGLPLNILLLILFAFLLRWILVFLLHRSVSRIVSGVKKSRDLEHTHEITQSPLQEARMVQRARTLGTVGKNFITWIVGLAALLVVLDMLGIRVSTLLASAGFVAAGLAFGAQNIVKDVLNGLFIVFEDQLGEGDVITVGETTGTVEEVGLRVTQLRAEDGTLWFIRNGDILKLGNHSYGWAKAMIHVDIDTTKGVSDVENKLNEIVQDLAKQPELARKILEMPAVLGVESVHAGHTKYLVTVKTRPGADERVARTMRAGIAAALTSADITIGPDLR